MDAMHGYAPLVELTRGGIVECVHYGAMAVVDAQGRLLASAGDPDLVTFPRSSMKPLQVLPFVERGGVEHFGLTPEELAIMCASHSGTDEHVRVLKSIHAKVGIHEGDLQCGVHWPMDKDTADALRARGEEPTSYRHNCSGKHSGMLAHATLRGAPRDSYLEIAHPIQQSILQAVAEMCDWPLQDLVIGTDGCSAPVFALPLRNFALGMARLSDPRELEEKRRVACEKICAAMSSFPLMVAGPGRIDTVLMRVMHGLAVVKGGAEGYQMLALLPGALGPGSAGVGVAFKFSDGDPSRRATHMLLYSLLKSMGFEKEMASEEFAPFTQSVLHNWRGLDIGEIRIAPGLRLWG